MAGLRQQAYAAVPVLDQARLRPHTVRHQSMSLINQTTPNDSKNQVPSNLRDRMGPSSGHAHFGQRLKICQMPHDISLADDSDNVVMLSNHKALHLLLNHLPRGVNKAGRGVDRG